MNRTLLAFVVLAIVAVPVTLVGKALDLGGLAWLGVLLGLMFVASLVDPEGFYGRSRFFSRRPRSR